MLLATILLWALNLSVTKYILSHGLGPLPYATVRYALAAAVFVALTLVVLASGREADLTNSPYPPASDIVWGPLALTLQASLSTLTPDARLVVLENSGRRIHADAPEAIVAAIREVVEAVRGPGGWQDARATPAG